MGFALYKCWSMCLKAVCSLLEEFKWYEPALLFTVLVSIQTCNWVRPLWSQLSLEGSDRVSDVPVASDPQRQHCSA